jgi:uncharacterized protein YggU (UPF0235/DUF167 family)
MPFMRVENHVRPSASMSKVGGEHGGALVVRVREPADKGRATAAALKAVADEHAVHRRYVTLTSGATSHRKVIEIECENDRAVHIERRLADLRASN